MSWFNGPGLGLLKTLFLQVSNNLSDLASANSARTNLGLGTLATVDDAASDGNTYGRNNAAWVAISSGATLTFDTRANILATASPSSGDMFYATDTAEFLIYDGTNFIEQPLSFQTSSTTPDIGVQPPLVKNDRAGYSNEYITDKSISNSRILSSDVEQEGSIRTVDGTFQIYLNSAWNDIVINFRFREQADDAGGSNCQLEHNPIGLNRWYEVLSGDSDVKGLNGLPVAQNYHTDIGAYPVPIRLQGRSLD